MSHIILPVLPKSSATATEEINSNRTDQPVSQSLFLLAPFVSLEGKKEKKVKEREEKKRREGKGGKRKKKNTRVPKVSEALLV